MAIISSTIYLGQIQTAVTRNPSHYLLAKTTGSNHHLKINSNWRVKPLIMLMGFIFPLIWMLGVAFSIDETTMRFKGYHAEKRMTYKSKGDGL